MSEVRKEKSVFSSLNLQKVTQIILILILLLTIGLRIWSLNRGFDITDEAYAVLGYEPLQERLEVVTAFHIIVYRLLGWLEPSLISYRAIGQLLNVLSATIFALCFCYWLQRIYQFGNKPFTQLFIILLFILGSFVLDHDTPFILNYNIINNTLNLSQAGLVLVLISQQNENIKRWQFKIGWLGVGFLVAFQFLNKATSAIAFTMVVVALIVLYQRCINWRYYSTVGGCFIAGGFLGLLTYFLLFQNFWEYQELLLRQLTQSLEKPGYFNYLPQNIALLKNNLPIILILLISGSLAIFGLSKVYFSLDVIKQRKKARLIAIMLWSLAISFVLALIKPLQLHLIKELNFNITEFYTLILALLLVIVAATFNNNPAYCLKSDIFGKVTAVAIFLMLLPFVATVGTDTYVQAMAARNIVPWLALIVILLTLLYQTNKANIFTYFFILSTIVWLGIKVTYTHIYQPYRLTENRLHQTELINFVQPHAQGLKVDPATAKFLNRINSAVRKTGFQRGDPMIALYDMPGIVYLLGGVSPGAPWYFSHFDHENAATRICNNFAHSNFAPSKPIFLVNSDISPQVLDCLKTTEINFPEDYQKVAEVDNPFHSTNSLRKQMRQKKTVAVWSSK